MNGHGALLVVAGLLALSSVMVDESWHSVPETLTWIGFGIWAAVNSVWMMTVHMVQSLVSYSKSPKSGPCAVVGQVWSLLSFEKRDLVTTQAQVLT